MKNQLEKSCSALVRNSVPFFNDASSSVATTTIPGLGGDETPADSQLGPSSNSPAAVGTTTAVAVPMVPMSAASSPEYHFSSDSNDGVDDGKPDNDDLSSDDAGKFYSDNDEDDGDKSLEV